MCGRYVPRSDKHCIAEPSTWASLRGRLLLPPWSEEGNTQPLDLATSVKLDASNRHRVEASGDLPREKRRREGYLDPNPATEVDDAANHLPKVKRHRQTAA